MDRYQILLLTGNVSIGDSELIPAIIHSIGFVDIIKMDDSETQSLRNNYAGFFSGKDFFSTIQEIKMRLKEELAKNNIGALEFLIIDITDSAMIHSIWHDGYY